MLFIFKFINNESDFALSFIERVVRCFTTADRAETKFMRSIMNTDTLKKIISNTRSGVEIYWRRWKSDHSKVL